jgi:hypothetical protein
VKGAYCLLAISLANNIFPSVSSATISDIFGVTHSNFS